METHSYPVEGMRCPNCKARLEKALCAIEGVEAAQASVEQKQVEVTFDPLRVTPSVLQEAAEDAGYGLMI